MNRLTKTLVVINIDETQDPMKWVSDKAQFDLVFLSYSKSEQFRELLNKTGCAWYDFETDNQGKWKNLHLFFKKNYDCLGRYDYFWFPDPDLEMEIDAVNGFFDFARSMLYDLCQPSLTADSFVSYEFTRNIIGAVYRKSPFVEIMCPLFSWTTLIRNIWTFELTSSGYGIDCFLWSRENECWIVHKYQIRHPRKPNYKITAKAAGFPDVDMEFEMVRELSDKSLTA